MTKSLYLYDSRLMGWDLVIKGKPFDVWLLFDDCRYVCCPAGEELTNDNHFMFQGEAPAWGIVVKESNCLNNADIVQQSVTGMARTSMKYAVTVWHTLLQKRRYALLNCKNIQFLLDRELGKKNSWVNWCTSASNPRLSATFFQKDSSYLPLMASRSLIGEWTRKNGMKKVIIMRS